MFNEKARGSARTVKLWCVAAALMFTSAPFAIAHAATDAAPGAAPATDPLAFTPEQTVNLCMVNATPDFDDIDSTRITMGTWTLFDNGDDPRMAIARVKAHVATIPAMHVISERYEGNHGTLDIVESLEGTTEDAKRGIPMRVEVDSDLGLIGSTLESSEGVGMMPQWTSYYVCQMASYAANAPQPVSPSATVAAEKPKRHLFNNPFKKAEENKPDPVIVAKRELFIHGREALYRRAERAGKAFVIVPLTNLATKYNTAARDTLKTEQLMPYWAEGSARTLWTVKGRTSGELSFGTWSSEARIGLRGYFDVIGKGKSWFGLYIVDPGTYEMRSATIERRNIALPTAQGAPSGKSIGTLTATNTMDKLFQLKEEWHDPTYASKGYDQSYCVMELVDGHCVQYATQRQYVTEQQSAGGYKTKVTETLVPGWTARIDLKVPFASFKAVAGEVALVDGLVLDRSSMDIDPNSCKPTNSGGSCALTELTPWRIPATVTDVQAALGREQNDFAARRIYEAAKPIPLTVDATPLAEPTQGFEAGWARPFERKAK